MDEPIVSVSLGCSAIFLIGGRTKETSPVAILLKSGDAVVMSGESRFCYHGVPVIIPSDADGDVWGDCASSGTAHDEDADAAVKRYLSIARINLNVRRVTEPGKANDAWTEKNGSGFRVVA